MMESKITDIRNKMASIGWKMINTVGVLTQKRLLLTSYLPGKNNDCLCAKLDIIALFYVRNNSTFAKCMHLSYGMINDLTRTTRLPFLPAFWNIRRHCPFIEVEIAKQKIYFE